MKKSKLFITFMPVILPLSATLPMMVSCNTNDITGPVFDITSEGELTGFNHNWSKEDIARKLSGQDTLVIPQNVVKISETAFFEVNSSYDIKSYTTIPSFIKKLDLTQATNLERIESGAFASAPFETIVFAKNIHYIDSFSFAYNLNLSCIDVSECDTFPIDSWAADAFDIYHSVSGVIKVKNMVSKVAWCDYFSLNNNFVFSANKWVADVQALDDVFTFEDQWITGFTNSFISAGWIAQKQLLYEISGDYQTLYVPLYHNGVVNGVASSAFYDIDSDKSLIPGDTTEEKVKYLTFEDGTEPLTVKENAFKKAPFYSITLSNNVRTIEKDAFNSLPLLQCIDASALASLPTTGWDTSTTTWQVNHTFEGKIILKINSPKHTEIASYFTSHGIPAATWSSDFKHADVYETTYGLLRGFHPDLTPVEVADQLSAGDNIIMNIDENVVAIGDNAFYSNGSSTIPAPIGVGAIKVIFGEGSLCDYIGKNAFAYARAMKEVKLPDGLKMIDTSAFYDNENLDTITLPNTLTTIGTYAFNSCKELLSINIPNKLTTLSSYAFYGCVKLATIDMTSFDEFTSVPEGWSTRSVFANLPEKGKIKLNSTLYGKDEDKALIKSYLEIASNEAIKFDTEHWQFIQE